MPNFRFRIFKIISLGFLVTAIITGTLLVISQSSFDLRELAFDYLQGEKELWKQGPEMSGTRDTDVGYDRDRDDPDYRERTINYCDGGSSGSCINPNIGQSTYGLPPAPLPIPQSSGTGTGTSTTTTTPTTEPAAVTFSCGVVETRSCFCTQSTCYFNGLDGSTTPIPASDKAALVAFLEEQKAQGNLVESYGRLGVEIVNEDGSTSIVPLNEDNYNILTGKSPSYQVVNPGGSPIGATCFIGGDCASGNCKPSGSYGDYICMAPGQQYTITTNVQLGGVCGSSAYGKGTCASGLSCGVDGTCGMLNAAPCTPGGGRCASGNCQGTPFGDYFCMPPGVKYSETVSGLNQPYYGTTIYGSNKCAGDGDLIPVDGFCKIATNPTTGISSIACQNDSDCANGNCAGIGKCMDPIVPVATTPLSQLYDPVANMVPTEVFRGTVSTTPGYNPQQISTTVWGQTPTGGVTSTYGTYQGCVASGNTPGECAGLPVTTTPAYSQTPYAQGESLYAGECFGPLGSCPEDLFIIPALAGTAGAAAALAIGTAPVWLPAVGMASLAIGSQFAWGPLSTLHQMGVNAVLNPNSIANPQLAGLPNYTVSQFYVDYTIGKAFSWGLSKGLQSVANTGIKGSLFTRGVDLLDNLDDAHSALECVSGNIASCQETVVNTAIGFGDIVEGFKTPFDALKAGYNSAYFGNTKELKKFLLPNYVSINDNLIKLQTNPNYVANTPGTTTGNTTINSAVGNIPSIALTDTIIDPTQAGSSYSPSQETTPGTTGLAAKPDIVTPIIKPEPVVDTSIDTTDRQAGETRPDEVTQPERISDEILNNQRQEIESLMYDTVYESPISTNELIASVDQLDIEVRITQTPENNTLVEVPNDTGRTVRYTLSPEGRLLSEETLPSTAGVSQGEDHRGYKIEYSHVNDDPNLGVVLIGSYINIDGTYTPHIKFIAETDKSPVKLFYDQGSKSFINPNEVKLAELKENDENIPDTIADAVIEVIADQEAVTSTQPLLTQITIVLNNLGNYAQNQFDRIINRITSSAIRFQTAVTNYFQSRSQTAQNATQQASQRDRVISQAETVIIQNIKNHTRRELSRHAITFNNSNSQLTTDEIRTEFLDFANLTIKQYPTFIEAEKILETNRLFKNNLMELEIAANKLTRKINDIQYSIAIELTKPTNLKIEGDNQTITTKVEVLNPEQQTGTSGLFSSLNFSQRISTITNGLKSGWNKAMGSTINVSSFIVRLAGIFIIDYFLAVSLVQPPQSYRPPVNIINPPAIVQTVSDDAILQTIPDAFQEQWSFRPINPTNNFFEINLSMLENAYGIPMFVSNNIPQSELDLHYGLVQDIENTLQILHPSFLSQKFTSAKLPYRIFIADTYHPSDIGDQYGSVYLFLDNLKSPTSYYQNPGIIQNSNAATVLHLMLASIERVNPELSEQFVEASLADGVYLGTEDNSIVDPASVASDDFLLYNTHQTNQHYAFSLSGTAYVYAPRKLKEQQPTVYRFFKEKVFHGLEYYEVTLANGRRSIVPSTTINYQNPELINKPTTTTPIEEKSNIDEVALTEELIPTQEIVPTEDVAIPVAPTQEELIAQNPHLEVVLPQDTYNANLAGANFQQYNDQSFLPYFAQAAEIINPGDTRFSFLAQAIYQTERGSVSDQTRFGLGGINLTPEVIDGRLYPSDSRGPVWRALYVVDNTLRPSDSMLTQAANWIGLSPTNDPRRQILLSYYHPDTTIAAKTQAFMSALILYQNQIKYGPWLAPLQYVTGNADGLIYQFTPVTHLAEEAKQVANESVVDLYRNRWGLQSYYGHQINNIRVETREAINEVGQKYNANFITADVTVNGKTVTVTFNAIQYLMNIAGDPRMGFFDRYNKLVYDANQGWNSNQSITSPQSTNVQTVMIMGDSIAQNIAAGPAQNFVKEIFAAQNVDFVGNQSSFAGGVPNQAYTGITTQEYANKLASSEISFTGENTPDIAIIQLGTNDLASGRVANQSDIEYKLIPAYESVIGQLVRANPSVTILILPISETTQSWNSMVDDVNAALVSMANKLNNDPNFPNSRVVVVNQGNPLFTANQVADDGVHPNLSGVQSMMEGIGREIITLFPEMVPSGFEFANPQSAADSLIIPMSTRPTTLEYVTAGQEGNLHPFTSSEDYMDLQSMCSACFLSGAKQDTPNRIVVPKNIAIHFAASGGKSPTEWGDVNKTIRTFVNGRLGINSSSNFVVGYDKNGNFDLKQLAPTYQNGVMQTKAITAAKNVFINIEMSGRYDIYLNPDGNVNEEVFNSTIVQETAQLVAKLSQYYNIPVDEIIGHGELASYKSKDAPQAFMDRFRGLVQQKINEQANISTIARFFTNPIVPMGSTAFSVIPLVQNVLSFIDFINPSSQDSQTQSNWLQNILLNNQGPQLISTIDETSKQIDEALGYVAESVDPDGCSQCSIFVHNINLLFNELGNANNTEEYQQVLGKINALLNDHVRPNQVIQQTLEAQSAAAQYDIGQIELDDGTKLPKSLKLSVKQVITQIDQATTVIDNKLQTANAQETKALNDLKNVLNEQKQALQTQANGSIIQRVWNGVTNWVKDIGETITEDQTKQINLLNKISTEEINASEEQRSRPEFYINLINKAHRGLLENKIDPNSVAHQRTMHLTNQWMGKVNTVNFALKFAAPDIAMLEQEFGEMIKGGAFGMAFINKAKKEFTKIYYDPNLPENIYQKEFYETWNGKAPLITYIRGFDYLDKSGARIFGFTSRYFDNSVELDEFIESGYKLTQEEIVEAITTLTHFHNATSHAHGDLYRSDWSYSPNTEGLHPGNILIQNLPSGGHKVIFIDLVGLNMWQNPKEGFIDAELTDERVILREREELGKRLNKLFNPSNSELLVRHIKSFLSLRKFQIGILINNLRR